MIAPTRREFLQTVATAAAATTATAMTAGGAEKRRRPNVLLMMTDDQGFGDLACHGNEVVRTPNLDRLYAESTRLSQFYVCPVCAPTRACLMTGRYNYRTGAIDTWVGRAMMHSEEVTVAEMLAKAGYRTGIFGKWHLGDNYPLRTIDQGFHESLVHNGGGIGQPSDPPNNDYFDPILQHNGKAVKAKGYCTDIFADAAIRFIEANRDRPWFVYLPTNAPHGPLTVAEKYYKPYLAKGVNEAVARVYGMVENIDENVGKLLRRLKDLKLEGNTIVIFLTDNGPAMGKSARYNANLRGGKGSVYEGGIRVPCFLRWPGKLTAGRDVPTIAAHIDLTPTLLDACGAEKDPELRLDGISLMPLLLDEKIDWPDRTLFFQWHRGDVPELYRACAARNHQYKMVSALRKPKGKKGAATAKPAVELYDLLADPGEKRNIAAEKPAVLAKLRKQYEAWFKDVGSTRGYAPPRIHVGTIRENPTILTPQDWRGTDSYAPGNLGHWLIHVGRTGRYEFRLDFTTVTQDAKVSLRLGKITLDANVKRGAGSVTLGPADVPAGDGKLEAWVAASGKKVGVRYLHVRKVE